MTWFRAGSQVWIIRTQIVQRQVRPGRHVGITPQRKRPAVRVHTQGLPPATVTVTPTFRGVIRQRPGRARGPQPEARAAGVRLNRSGPSRPPARPAGIRRHSSSKVAAVPSRPEFNASFSIGFGNAGRPGPRARVVNY